MVEDILKLQAAWFRAAAAMLPPPPTDYSRLAMAAANDDAQWLRSVGVHNETQQLPPPQSKLDAALEAGAYTLGLCQNVNHWSVRYADALWPGNDCACCFAFRHLFVGLIAGGIIGAVGVAILDRVIL